MEVQAERFDSSCNEQKLSPLLIKTPSKINLCRQQNIEVVMIQNYKVFHLLPACPLQIFTLREFGCHAIKTLKQSHGEFIWQGTEAACQCPALTSNPE